MSRKEQHTDKLLRRWINGEVNRREEAELEAAARDDAFLAEAMEGYRRRPEADHSAQLRQLRGRLSVAPRRRRPIVMIQRIAAAIALLIAIGAALWYTPLLNKQGPSLSMEEMLVDAPPAADEKLSREDAPAVASQAPETERREDIEAAPPSEPPAVAVTPRREEQERGARASTPSETIYLADDAEVVAKDSPVVVDGVPIDLAEEAVDIGAAADYDVSTEAEEVVAETEVTLPPTSTPAPPPAPAGRDVYVAPANALDPQIAISNMGPPRARQGFRLVEGVVTDTEGYPLIGASVLQQGTTQGTVTDLEGRFMMALDSANQSLEVNYTGYQPQAVTVAEDADDIEVVMEEGMTLDEVVVSGYATQRTQEREDEDTRPPFARPIGGLSAYKDYVNERTELVQGRGKVRLQFFVHADGSIQDIEIIRSTNPSLNLLARRILEEGPRWEIIAGGAPVQTVYTIRFP